MSSQTWIPAHSRSAMAAARLIAAMLVAAGAMVAIWAVSSLDLSLLRNSAGGVIEERVIYCSDNGAPVYDPQLCIVPFATSTPTKGAP